jgi:hypothetical protein
MKNARCSSRTRGMTRAAIALSLLLSTLMGGCPDFRNGVVDAIDSASRSVLLGDAGYDEAVETAVVGVFDAALDLFFDQFRTDDRR